MACQCNYQLRILFFGDVNFITDESNQLLVDQIRVIFVDGIPEGIPRVLNSNYVFCKGDGTPYSALHTSLRQAAERAGVEGFIGLHQIRHAFCSHALMQGIDPRTVQRWMGHKDLKTTLRYAHVSPDHDLPANHGIETVFCGDDIAFKTGPLLSPAWFQAHYFERLARICAAYRRQRIRLLFHSDGDLRPILDGLVEAGIDGLNPLEVLAGMEPAEVHRRFPQLFLAGGIDVSQLLPLGSPDQVRDTVRRAVDECGGRLMVGSSTELNDEVPLDNYLALRDAVLDGAGS